MSVCITGPYRRCSQCESDDPPEIISETYDAIDQVVVVHQVCAGCRTEFQTLRHATKAELRQGDAAEMSRRPKESKR